jgi:hypothetical protein
MKINCCKIFLLRENSSPKCEMFAFCENEVNADIQHFPSPHILTRTHPYLTHAVPHPPPPTPHTHLTLPPASHPKPSPHTHHKNPHHLTPTLHTHLLSYSDSTATSHIQFIPHTHPTHLPTPLQTITHTSFPLIVQLVALKALL